MAQMRDIKRRIRSVKNIQQITKAMKMVAAAKLRRAQERMLAMRPYSDKLAAMLNIVLPEVTESDNPMVDTRPVKNALVILLTGDKGLCGAFNNNIIHYAEDFLNKKKEEGIDTKLITIGSKGYQYFAKKDVEIVANYRDFYDQLQYINVTSMINPVIDRFLSEEYDEIYLVYNEFITVLSQQIVDRRLLPILPEDIEKITEKSKYVEDESDEEDKINPRAGEICEIEPDVVSVCTDLFRRYLSTGLFHAMLESIASEFGARMTAMEAATKNSADMIDRLTLVYNRARQAAITKEISEIVGGADALDKA